MQEIRTNTARLLSQLSAGSIDVVGARLIRLALCGDNPDVSCWNLQWAPVVLSLSFDKALARSEPTLFIELWRRFLDHEALWLQERRRATGSQPKDALLVKKWLTAECEAYWADVVDNMARDAVPPLVELCGRYLDTKKRLLSIGSAPIPEELKQRLRSKPWRLRCIAVRVERMPQDELFNIRGLRWVWKRQRKRLDWVRLCGVMAEQGVVSQRLGIAAFRSLLLNVTQLHDLYIQAQASKVMGGTIFTDEGATPARGQAEKETQMIEEETLDLVTVLEALFVAHFAEWQKLLGRPPQEGTSNEDRGLLVACLERTVAFMTKDGLGTFSVRSRPKLAEAAQRSAQLLGATYGLLPDLTAA